MSNAPAPDPGAAAASDSLSKTLFTMIVVGTIAFVGVVLVFVIF